MHHLMIELRTLGTVDLARPADGPIDVVLRQPKRLALLCYLAMATPGRPQRRDTLLAHFWPDLDQEHARAALRRALYFLRRAVEDQVLTARGEEEIGVDSSHLWCDALAFEAHLDAGDFASALELYQGDFLGGYYVTGAPEIERWLDGERVRLRDRAATAAGALAHSASTLIERIGWARRGIALVPDDEDALTTLVTLLGEAGERTDAIRTAEEFIRRLKREYDLEPGALLRGALASLKTGHEATGGKSSPGKAGLIAVLPFAVHGSADLVFLAEGMVDLLSTALDGAGSLSTVDPRSLLGAVPPGEPLDPERGRLLAVRFGADRFILGSIVGAGGRLQAVATIYDRDLRAIVRAEVKRAGEGELFELVDDLVRQLIAGDNRGPATRLITLAALTTDSVPALKHYLLGECALRLGRYLEAIDAFQQAVGIDPSFALAHFRLAAGLAANVMIVPAREAMTSAWRHRERLTQRDQLLLSAQRAWLLGNTAEAEQHAGALVAHYPEDVEGWFLLGDLAFHSNPLRGRPAAAARSAFERVLSLDPGHMGALVHLVRVAALEERVDEVDTLVSRALSLSPAGDQGLGIRALRAWLRGDRGLQEAVLAEVPGARVLAAGTAFADLSVYAADPAGAELFWTHCLAAARSEQLKALYHILGSSVAFARGRRRTALEYLARAADVDPDNALAVRAVLLVTAEPALSAETLAALHGELLSWNTAAARDASLPFPIHEGVHGHLRAYLLGLIESAQGDPAAPARRVEEMAELSVPAGSEALVERLERTLAAAGHRQQGRIAEALAILEGGRSEVWFQLAIASPFYAGGYERLVRADLLIELGRLEEAAGWLHSLAERSPFETPYLPGALRRLIAIHERRDEGGPAGQCRARLARLLSEADPIE
jgi:DNA-binding SARP family transcriptional activator